MIKLKINHILEWEHSKAFVHAWCVRKEGSESSLKYEAEVQGPVPHSLVEEGVSSSLANDQISPLDNDDGYKESGVAGEFQGLAIAVCLQIYM